jgi:hypothetical protein
MAGLDGGRRVGERDRTRLAMPRSESYHDDVVPRGKKSQKLRAVSNLKQTGRTATGKTRAAARAEEDKPRRVPNWARFVIGAFVTAIVGILVTALYPVIRNLIFHAPPITFKVNQIVDPGWGITVPDQQRLQPLLNSINSCPSLHNAAVKGAGVDDYSTILHVVVQGNNSSGVTITGMHVRIIKRSAPLQGAYVFCQSAGSIGPIPLNFNLNDRVPFPHPSFFANGSVVHLNDGEVKPFSVQATITRSAVEWVIEASIIVNGQSRTVTIGNNGRPFETTGLAPPSQYGDLYEYDYAAQQRLLHFRGHARNPSDCAADVAMKALRSHGLGAFGQVLSVDCAGDMAHVEAWVPSDHCFAHYLGFHRQSHWLFFASRAVCLRSSDPGALFSRATILHAGGNPQAFANAFGPYIVSSGSIPANPGPYDRVPQLSVNNLATRAGCTLMRSFSNYSVSFGASQSESFRTSQFATCKTQGASFIILTFPDSGSRNKFYSVADGNYKWSAIHPLLVIGPTWLVYETVKGGAYVYYGRTLQQFAQKVGGEAGQYAFSCPHYPNDYAVRGCADVMNGNHVPTIANGGL